MEVPDFSGEWASEYTYHGGLVGEHDLSLRQEGNAVTGTGMNHSGSQLTLKLEYDPGSRTLTGIWHESTSPSGDYKGAEFHGAVQFIVNEALNAAEGTWVGFNRSKTKINTGEWELKKS